MSGGEPSSIKQFSRCAAGKPVLSRVHFGACKLLLDFWVYGLTSRLVWNIKESENFASGTVQKIPSNHV